MISNLLATMGKVGLGYEVKLKSRSIDITLTLTPPSQRTRLGDPSGHNHHSPSMDDTPPVPTRIQRLGWSALEQYYQTRYCNLVWRLVEELIRMGQHETGVRLDPQQKRYARSVVVGWVTELTGLAVDLSLTESLVSLDPDQLPFTHREIDHCRQQLYEQFPEAIRRLSDRDF